MQTRFTTPTVAPMADEYELYTTVNDNYNILIAGRIGAGKSVFEHGMAYNLLNHYTPEELEMYLIDPKRVELRDFIGFPHVKGYANTVDDSILLLEKVESIMNDRYDYMARHRGMKMYDGSHIYVFIDELAMLMSKAKKEMTALLENIMFLGRAALIHVVCCTQAPSRLCLPAQIQQNFTCRVGLWLDDAIDSRQIVKSSGCELFDGPGKCILHCGGIHDTFDVPMYTNAHYRLMERYWMLGSPISQGVAR